MRNRWMFTILMLVFGLCLCGTALAVPNDLVMPGTAANYEDPVDYDTDPVHVASAGNGATRFKVALEPGKTFWRRRASDQLPTGWAGYLIGLGMAHLGDPNQPLDKGQAFDRMPIGHPVPGENAVEFVVRIPDNVEARYNLPTQYAGNRGKSKIWGGNSVPMYGWIGGWEAQGKIYTEDPDGNNNGYALVKRGGKYYPVGTGRIGPPVKSESD